MLVKDGMTDEIYHGMSMRLHHVNIMTRGVRWMCSE